MERISAHANGNAPNICVKGSMPRIRGVSAIVGETVREGAAPAASLPSFLRLRRDLPDHVARAAIEIALRIENDRTGGICPICPTEVMEVGEGPTA